MIRLWISLTWLALSAAWISADHVLRDGDEEGHVGAAELFEQQLARGEFLAFADDAWRGDLGEYPPLFPALVGAAWRLAGPGQPARLPVRGVCLLGLLVAAWATGRTAAELAGPRRDPGGGAALRADRLVARLEAERAATAAFLFVLVLPLANGLARHFMPEGMLVGAVALAVLSAVRAGRRPGPLPAALLGLVLGLGLLVKQTFLGLAVLPVLVGAARQRRWWALTVAVAAAVAGPWYLAHLPEQLAYLGRSAEANAPVGALAGLAYYPLVTGWIGLGPPLAALALGAAVVAWRRGGRREVLLGAAWLLGGLLLLTLVPKKYPRLMAPLAPGAALWLAALVVRVHVGAWLSAAAALLGGGWLAWASVLGLPYPQLVRDFHARCMQEWLRPPLADDQGMSAVAAAAAQAPPGPVVVVGGPAIPCDVQTTHDWAYHLGPYLRREEQERAVVAVTAGPAPAGALVVDWTGGPGREVAVPSLGRALHIR